VSAFFILLPITVGVAYVVAPRWQTYRVRLCVIGLCNRFRGSALPFGPKGDISET